MSEQVNLDDVEDLASRYLEKSGERFEVDLTDYSLEGPEAEEQDLMDIADFVMDTYDDLLEVDSEGFRDKVKDSIIYQPSRPELLRPNLNRKGGLLYGAGMASGAFLSTAVSGGPELAVAGGLAIGQYLQMRWNLNRSKQNYDRHSQDIGVSTGSVNVREGLTTLAPEIFHFYQQELDSPTWDGSLREIFSEDARMRREGTERAMRIKALEAAKEEEFMNLDWSAHYEDMKASTMVNGYAELLDSRTGNVDKGDIERVGVGSDTAEEVIDNVGSVNNRCYDLTAASMLASEAELGEKVYADVFHGEIDPVDLTGIR